MSNPLTDILPAPARKYLYALYALAGVVCGALAVAGVNVGKAAEVLAFLGTALGLVAASNTAPSETDERGALDLWGAVLIVVLLGVVLLLFGVRFR